MNYLVLKVKVYHCHTPSNLTVIRDMVPFLFDIADSTGNVLLCCLPHEYRPPCTKAYLEAHQRRTKWIDYWDLQRETKDLFFRFTLSWWRLHGFHPLYLLVVQLDRKHIHQRLSFSWNKKFPDKLRFMAYKNQHVTCTKYTYKHNTVSIQVMNMGNACELTLKNRENG